MEDKKINEAESFAIISQMINNSKKRIQIGSGNTYIFWGILTALVSLAVWALPTFTGSYLWCYLWFILPLSGWPITYIMSRQNKNRTRSYLDKVIDNIWTMCGIMFAITMAILGIFNAWILMMPLTLLFCSMAVCMNGVVLRFNWLIYLPIISFTVGILMLIRLTMGEQSLEFNWTLVFGACFIIMMLIPGILLNRKAVKDNV